MILLVENKASSLNLNLTIRIIAIISFFMKDNF